MPYNNVKVKQRQPVAPTTTSQRIGIVSEVPMNEWDAEITYEKLNIVTYKGGTFIAKTQNKGIAPFDSDGWKNIWMPLLNGVGISSVVAEYAYSDTSTSEPPTSGWSATIPEPQVDKYLWTRVTIIYTDNERTVYYSVGIGGIAADFTLYLVEPIVEESAGDFADEPFRVPYSSFNRKPDVGNYFQACYESREYNDRYFATFKVVALDDSDQNASVQFIVSSQISTVPTDKYVDLASEQTIDGKKVFKSGADFGAPIDVADEVTVGVTHYADGYVQVPNPETQSPAEVQFPTKDGILALLKDIKAPLCLIEPLVEESAGDFADEPFGIPLANFNREPVVGELFQAWYTCAEDDASRISVFRVESIASDRQEADVALVSATTQNTYPVGKFVDLESDQLIYGRKTFGDLLSASEIEVDGEVILGATGFTIPNLETMSPASLDFPRNKEGTFALTQDITWENLPDKPTIPTIPDITVVDNGSGNAVTGVSANGHTITLTKGETFAKNADLTALNGRVATIEGKIPTQASATNQLADKAFVNSTVQTATANFRGNWTTWATVPAVVDSYPADYAGSKTPTVNDYLVVQNASDYSGQTLSGTWRFKYSGDWATNGKNGWQPEYQVNETPLTAAQLAALNSGATAALIGQITTNKNDITAIKTKNTEQDNSITLLTDRVSTVESKNREQDKAIADVKTVAEKAYSPDNPPPIPSLTNYVTTNTDQSITGKKTFDQAEFKSTIDVGDEVNVGFTHYQDGHITVPNPAASSPAELVLPTKDGTIALISDIPSSLPISGAAGGDLTGTYPNPTIADGKIGKAKLDSAVQASLRKADTALQSHQSLSNYYTKAETDAAITAAIDAAITKALNTPV